MVLAKSERRNLNRDTILDVRNLTKVFGSGRNATVAVDNISFSIKRGKSFLSWGKRQWQDNHRSDAAEADATYLGNHSL